MRARPLVLALCLMGVSGVAWAAPDRSLRPEPRPEFAGLVPDPTVPFGIAVLERARGNPLASLRPEPRRMPVAVARAPVVLGRGVLRSPIPMPRPDGLAAPVRAGLFAGLGTPRQSRRGSVCGVRDIRGEAIAPIAGTQPGCGVAAPVRVTEVDGVMLSQPAIMDCPTALALRDWINEGARPAVGRTGSGLAGLQVAAHYACRTRNNKPGARISEHGKGRAIDISALLLRDGTRITLSDDWGRGRGGRILRASHGAACGPFGTVLGPEADRYHLDHFHFDTAQYRSGPYCR